MVARSRALMIVILRAKRLIIVGPLEILPSVMDLPPLENPISMTYQFTNNWFEITANLNVWEEIFSKAKPQRILEIGSYEGKSACWILEHMDSDAHLTCVDTWEGGGDLSPEMMAGVEERFDANVAVARWKGKLEKVKRSSVWALSDNLWRENKFDFIYIDGSHTAPNVLTDGVMAYHVLEKGGFLVFDDYTWKSPKGDILDEPSIAIDYFAHIFKRTMETIDVGGQRVFRRVG